MALSDMREQVREEIGGRTDLDARIDEQLNFSAKEFATQYEFEELDTIATTPTVDGKADYLLPSDLYVLWSVKEETKLNRKLTFKDFVSYQDVDETKKGVPSWYTTHNRKLIIFNMVPDDNDGSNYLMAINYWRRHPDMVNDGDNTILPEEWERGIRLRATAYMFTILDQDEKAAAKHAECDRWMTRIRLPKEAEKKKAKHASLNFGYGSTWR